MKQNDRSVYETEHYLQYNVIVNVPRFQLQIFFTVLLMKKNTYILDGLRVNKLTTDFHFNYIFKNICVLYLIDPTEYQIKTFVVTYKTPQNVINVKYVTIYLLI